jgi:site-specific DNA-cytosine methylase
VKALISERDFVRIQEAANILGVTEQTLRNWDKAGKLPARRHPANGYRMYRVADLHAFLRSMEGEPEPSRGQAQLTLLSSPERETPLEEGLPPCHWTPEVALDPKHRPQRWDAPSSTVRRDWRKYPQEAYVLSPDGTAYRRLSVEEIALIQGIDPSIVSRADLSDRRRIAALGDAVPPPMARAIAGALDELMPWENRTALEFCAGIGGLAEGAASIGLDHLALVDHSEDCAYLLRNGRAWDGRVVHVSDVKEFDFSKYAGKVGLLSGGPPCQPWSQAGHGLGASDERDLLGDVPHIVNDVAPEAFVIENVPGLTSDQNLPYLEDVVRRLRSPGGHHTYGVMAGILNAADFGVPQTRRRLFLIGFRDAPAGLAYRCFDRIAARATHRDPTLSSNGLPAWVAVGSVIGERPDPGGWRRWIGH